MSTINEIDSSEQTSSYDDVQYPSHAYDVTHPDQLYTLAKLFKLQPTLPKEAKVLELGCAGGGNLIPVALQLPDAKFVGVDLSAKQISEAKSTVEKLGLKNIDFRAEDFQNIDESYGEFDYIICHGVFSWVPHAAQQRILEICRDRLSPNGIAYVSYNAKPGWFMRGMIREMMLHHIKNIPDPINKVKQARALLGFLVTSTEGQDSPYAKFLKQELDMLSKHSDAYLFHDHLEENNHPMFFYEFMDMARACDLQFLGESNLASMITENLPTKAAEALKNLTTDVYQRSQYTDFVTNRMFRQSLLCHKSQKVDRHINEKSLEGAFYSGRFQPTEKATEQDVTPQTEVAFKCVNGRTISTNHPTLKALMFTLNDAWPTSLDFPEICERIKQRLPDPAGAEEKTAIATVSQSHLLQMLVRGDIEMRFLADHYVEEISEFPKVSAYAIMQAEAGSTATTQRHNTLQLDGLTRLMLPFIDGTRSKPELVECLSELAKDGKLKIDVKGTPPEDMTPIHSAAVDKILNQLRRSAMLIGN